MLIVMVIAIVLAAASLPVGSVIPGPSERAPAGSPASAAGAAPRHVTIRRGDTLAGVAARAGSDAATIARLNPSADPGRLVPGRSLKLPR